MYVFVRDSVSSSYGAHDALSIFLVFVVFKLHMYVQHCGRFKFINPRFRAFSIGCAAPSSPTEQKGQYINFIIVGVTSSDGVLLVLSTFFISRHAPPPPQTPQRPSLDVCLCPSEG